VALPALTARHRVPLRQIKATRLTKTNTSDVDADALAAELRRHVRGEVRFDDGSRALYATDGSNYRQVPIGVVLPRDIDDITATMATARRYGAPVLARGGGTSLAGQCCNVAVVLWICPNTCTISYPWTLTASGHVCNRAWCSTTCATLQSSIT
jgi:hypothetical protein